MVLHIIIINVYKQLHSKNNVKHIKMSHIIILKTYTEYLKEHDREDIRSLYEVKVTNTLHNKLNFVL